MSVPRDVAKQFFHDGEINYASGRYSAAVSSYQRAYELSLKPGLLFAIANAEEREGSYEQAAQTLRSYLPAARSIDRPVLEKRIASLEQRAQQKRDFEQELERLRQYRLQAEPQLAKLNRPRDYTGWVVGGAGATLLVASLVTGLLSDSAGRRADAGCVDGLCLSQVQDDLRKERRYALASDVLLGLGLAGVGAGAALYVRSSLADGSHQVGLAGAF